MNTSFTQPFAPETFRVERGTLATLPDAYALHPDRQDAKQRMQDFRQRVAEGKSSPEQFILLRSGRGIEAVTLAANNPRVPLFARTRLDVPAAGLTQFYRYLHEHEAKHLLLLDSNLTVLDAGPAEAAGWVLDDRQVVYETDLSARRWTLAPEVQEGGPERLQEPEVAALLAELGQADWQPSEGWLVAVMPGEDGKPAALGGVGPRDHAPTININLVGVKASQRGKGLGQRLHAHLLARAAERHDKHMGGTEADNMAMVRIFEANGASLVSQQLYLRAKH